MDRSQSLKKIPSEEAAEFKEGKRASSHPNLSHSPSLSNAELRSSRSVEDLRRKIVRLNKELEAEKAFAKQLRREKSIDLKHAREEEQRRSASMQTDLKTKLHKEKTNELTALKEQMHKEKEKEILQIIKQKDELLKTAQQSWLKEKDELRARMRAEIWSDAREESKKEFDRERTRLEQEVLDLRMQKKEMEEALKILQESDKRKADEIRKIFHEHEIELEKFKRNSWQESRRQVSQLM
jgi:hypothetical protein